MLAGIEQVHRLSGEKGVNEEGSKFASCSILALKFILMWANLVLLQQFVRADLVLFGKRVINLLKNIKKRNIKH